MCSRTGRPHAYRQVNPIDYIAHGEAARRAGATPTRRDADLLRLLVVRYRCRLCGSEYGAG